MNNLIIFILLIIILLYFILNKFNADSGIENANIKTNCDKKSDQLKLLHLLANELILQREYAIRFVNKLGNQADLLEQIRMNNYNIIAVICKYQPASNQTHIKELFDQRINLLDKLIISMVTNYTDGYIDTSEKLVQNINLICDMTNKKSCRKIYIDYITNLDDMFRKITNQKSALDSFNKLNGLIMKLSISLI